MNYTESQISKMNKTDLEEKLFPYEPDAFEKIARSRQYGVPKAYKNYASKYKVNEHTVFFESNLGKQYTGNPRYIYERMLELYPDWTYIWAYNGDNKIPGNPIVVKRASDEYYKYLAQSKYLINNTVFPLWFPRQESFYLQTWHGTPYKRLHWDIEIRPVEKKSDPAFFCKSRSWNALLSPNHYSTERFRTAFLYPGSIWESGYPANDIFSDKLRYESKRAAIREHLGIEEDAKVYLYAPTWRDKGHLGNYMFKFDLLFDPETFLRNAPEGAKLLIRGHHMSASQDALSQLPEGVLDVSSWDDAIELMCASDVLITDYSSIVFDWYCSKKPAIYYVPDYDKYNSELRGSYFDLEEINAGAICKTEEELYKAINEVDDAEFHEHFYEMFCAGNDGTVTDRVIKKMLDITSPKKTLKDKLKGLFRK